VKKSSGCSSCLKGFLLLGIISVSVISLPLIFLPGVGKWSKGPSFEEYQTYFPTKYRFPTKEDFCFKSKNTSRDDCRYFCDYGPCDHDQVTLPIRLNREASKKRLIEIAKEVYKDFPDRKIILVFFIRGGDLQLRRIYKLKDKYYAFAKASFPNNTFDKDNIEIVEFFWNPDEFKYLLTKLTNNLERKEEVLLGSWLLGDTLYWLIKKKNYNNYRFEYFLRGWNKGYRSESWTSSKKKNEFILNQVADRTIEDHKVKCESNKCGDLIHIKSGSMIPNILKLEGLIEGNKN